MTSIDCHICLESRPHPTEFVNCLSCKNEICKICKCMINGHRTSRNPDQSISVYQTHICPFCRGNFCEENLLFENLTPDNPLFNSFDQPAYIPDDNQPLFTGGIFIGEEDLLDTDDEYTDDGIGVAQEIEDPPQLSVPENITLCHMCMSNRCVNSETFNGGSNQWSCCFDPFCSNKYWRYDQFRYQLSCYCHDCSRFLCQIHRTHHCDVDRDEQENEN